jgi:hypothetical protein
MFLLLLLQMWSICLATKVIVPSIFAVLLLLLLQQ